MQEDDSLIIFERAAGMLAEADTVQKCKEGKDLCFTAERIAKAKKLSEEAIQYARSYALEFERKLGEMLKTKPNPAQEHGGPGRGKKGASPGDAPFSSTPSLEELGVSQHESKTAQAVADLPTDTFQAVKAGTISKKAAIKQNKATKHQGNGEKPNARRSDKPAKEHDRQPEVAILYDAGKTGDEIADELGITKHQVANIVRIIRAKRSGQVEVEITPDMLSMTAQQKLDTAIRQHKERLAAEWRLGVSAEAKELLANTIGPRLQREQDQAKREMTRRKGIIDKKSYRKIWSCLHPDRITDPEQKDRYAEAFRIFSAVEKLLLNEKDSPTEFVGIPKTAAEWDELKRQTSADRKSKRTGAGGLQTK